MKRKVKSIFKDINFQNEITDNMKKSLEKEGYKILSTQGKHRLVFTSPKENRVIKVARTGWDIEHNKNEYKLWNQYKNTNLLCPVTNNSPEYIWIEMKYCDAKPELFSEYEQKMIKNGIYIKDINKYNVGILIEEETLICYDYPEIGKY